MIASKLDHMKYYWSLTENKEFARLKTNRERIEFILKSVRPLSDCRQEICEMAEKYHSEHSKSDTRSKEYRNEGLKYYYNNDNKNAIFMFKKAILSAPIPVEYDSVNELSQAYAHTSLAQFNDKQYERSLMSADLSLKLFETKEILIHRIHCLRLLKRYTKALQSVDQLIERCHSGESPHWTAESVEPLLVIKRYLIRLMTSSGQSSDNSTDESSECLTEDMKSLVESLPKDTKESEFNVWLHPSCQIMQSEGKGRHVVAKQFIPKGTIVLLERPTSILRRNKLLSTLLCANCHNRIRSTVFPCNGCDEVVYCNKECAQMAYKTYHRYECGVFGLLLDFGHGFIHSYRLITRVGIQKAIQCEQQNNGYDFESYLKSEDIHFEEVYKAYSSLVTHCSKYDNFSNIFHTLSAIDAAIIFDYTNQLDFDIEEDFDKFVTFVELILKNGRRVLPNVFGWTDYVKSAPKSRLNVGSCVCNVSALFNHSCQPNIYWHFFGPKMVFQTITDINPGQELCVTYGPTHKTSRFMDRQKKLKSSYFFDCNCEPCLRECQTVMCVRCDHCSGSIVYKDLEPFSQIESCCLHCGQKVVNLKGKATKITALSQKFDQMIKHLENKYNIDQSLKTATNLLESLTQLVYNKSIPLRDYFKQLIRAFVRHYRFGEAVQCIEFFSEFIDLKYGSVEDKDSISADIVDELLLLTNSYYMYLIKSQNSDQKSWDNCFQFYEKLILCLKNGKKLSKARDRSDKQIKGLTAKLRTTIRKKKNEFIQLKRYYHSMVTSIKK